MIDSTIVRAQHLKQYRCIATRYDKTADAFLGGIHLAAAVIWLN